LPAGARSSTFFHCAEVENWVKGLIFLPNEKLECADTLGIENRLPERWLVQASA
jgi:hypothetical protein